MFLSLNQMGDMCNIFISHTLGFVYTTANDTADRYTYFACSVSLQRLYSIQRKCLQNLIQRTRLHIFLSSYEKGDMCTIFIAYTLDLIFSSAYDTADGYTYFACSVSLQRLYPIQRNCLQNLIIAHVSLFI